MNIGQDFKNFYTKHLGKNSLESKEPKEITPAAEEPNILESIIKVLEK